MSQSAQILDALKRGEKLTPLDALERMGCFRLAARIQELREAGHSIWTETIYQNGKQFARYWMIAR